MAVLTGKVPTVIDLIARGFSAKSSETGDNNPLRLVSPHSQPSTKQRLGRLHDVKVRASFETSLELIRKGYHSLKNLINKPVFNLDQFITIQNNLIKNYEAVNNLHLDKLRKDIDIPAAQTRRQEANNKPIPQFKNQITILENMNDSLINNIEQLENNFNDLSLTAKEIEYLRETPLGKTFKLQTTSTGLFTEIIAEQKQQVLKNLAKIFSSSISSEDERMTKTLQEKRFKGLYHQILDIYESHIPTKGGMPNPFEQRNFNDYLIEKEIHQPNYQNLSHSEQANLNEQINGSTDPVEKNKLTLKKNDLIYGVGRRDALIENLNTLYKNDFRETVKIIKRYVENSFKNESSINHQELMPDGTIGPRDLAVLGLSDAARREKHVHALRLKLTIGGINEIRVSIAAQFLNQLLETGDIKNYLEIKNAQYEKIGRSIDKDPDFNTDFSIERIVHFLPRGPFDISGSDLGLLIKEKKENLQTGSRKENAEPYSYKFIRIQVKSSERGAAKSMSSKYPDIPGLSHSKNQDILGNF
jgi:hypothetical protein